MFSCVARCVVSLLLFSAWLPAACGQSYPWPYQAPGYYDGQYQQYGQPQRPAKPRKKMKRTEDAPSDADYRADESAATANTPFDGPVTTIIWSESDSLQRIASATGVSAARILAVNRLRSSDLRDGQAVVVPEPVDKAAGLPAAFKPEERIRREVWRGVRGSKRIALTFDAGSDDAGFETLMSNLEKLGVSATFFMTGEFQKRFPHVITRIHGAGYGIHNHSWSHPEFTKLPPEAIERELDRTEKAIAGVTGASTKPYWRPPFGDRDNRVLRTAASLGYQSIYWTVDSLDSFGEPKSASFIVNRILNPPSSGSSTDSYLDGAIVLMHIGTPGTPQAVPEIVARLRERGFTFVTVDDILKP